MIEENKMRPVLFQIGSVNLYSYGLMIAIGIVCAIFFMEMRAPKYGLDKDVGFNLAICAAIFGLLGAKLLYLIIVLPELIKDPSRIMDYLTGGFVVFGGIIGGTFACWVYTRIKGWDFLSYFDLFFPSIALAQAFGRIGCFMAGCCYGKETDGPLSVVFHEHAYGQAPVNVPLVPTQLISAALNFLNCAVLCLFARKTKKDGQVGGLYLINYSVGRFVIEFFRGDERGSIGPLSTSQFISIFTLIIGLFFFFTARERTATKPADTVSTLGKR